MRTLLFLSLLIFSSVYADDEVVTPEETVNPTEFFTRISGQYVVDLVNGEKPHEGTDAGLVMIDGTDGLFSFSFCHPEGMCDPNDQYLPLDRVTVVKTAVSDSAVSYELSYTENEMVRRFSWDEVDNKIILKNYQYIINDNLVTLEHQLHKKTEESPLD